MSASLELLAVTGAPLETSYNDNLLTQMPSS